MNELVNELMLIISTISAVLAGATALVSEMRMRRRDRVISDAPENLDTRQPMRNSS
jgi:hypothetical protein